MAEEFVIKGQKPLEGEVEISGYKNAAGPCLAASLLTDEEVILDNLPLVEDVLDMVEVLKGMGAKIEWLDKKKIRINGSDIAPEKIDPEKVSKTRISSLLIGALISRFKEFKFFRPGGDRIGLRPITTHLRALKELGIDVSQKGDFYYFKRGDLNGKEVVLEEFSVTATENLMMAAVLSKGKTIIKMAAAEPQVQDLGKMLKSMGARIEGVGTHTIEIEGVKKLSGTTHKICPDPLEAGTFVIIGSVTPGRVRIKNVNFNHLDSFLKKMKDIGVRFQKGENEIIVDYSSSFKPAKVQALPFPGFPTDLVPIIVPLLTQAEGKSLIHDPLYENRLGYNQELRRMGADIEIIDPHRAFVFGKTPLYGVKIESWDIRAGASLVVAGLLVSGETIIKNIYQIDRGYEKIDEKLQKLGADIRRVST